jgi:hypothetical protein
MPALRSRLISVVGNPARQHAHHGRYWCGKWPPPLFLYTQHLRGEDGPGGASWSSRLAALSNIASSD